MAAVTSCEKALLGGKWLNEMDKLACLTEVLDQNILRQLLHVIRPVFFPFLRNELFKILEKMSSLAVQSRTIFLMTLSSGREKEMFSSRTLLKLRFPV